MKIVVADDDRFFLKVIEDMLTGAGHQVILAGSGPEALDRIIREVPDLVILDVLMPGMLGAEVSERLRRYSSSAGVPVLLMSSFIPKGDGATGGHEDFLADDFIQKPFEAAELLERVEQLGRGGSKFGHLGSSRPPEPAPKKLITFDEAEEDLGPEDYEESEEED